MGFLIPVLVFIAIRLQFIDFVPRWDSSEYFQVLYTAISNFKPELEYINKNFNWFGHISVGYGLFTSILQFINPTEIKILQLTNIFLGILGIISFYFLAVFITNKKNKLEAILITLIFAVHPAFIATSITYVPDFGTLVFLLLAICSYIYNKTLLTIVSGLLLVFTKEIGVLSWFVFATSYSFLNFDKKRVVILFTPLIIYLIYVYLSKSFSWSPDGDNFLKFGYDCRFCFSYNFFNISEYLKVFFIMNFNWILTTIIIFGAIKDLINKRFFKEKLIISFLGTMMAICLFFLTFIIYVYTRYGIAYLGLYLIIAYYFLGRLIKKDITRKYILLFISLLMLLGNFRTIDPVSKKAFGTFNLGNHEILKIGTDFLGDGMTYNTQFIYVQRLLEKFLKDYKITQTDNIFIDPYAWGNFKFGWGHFTMTQPKIYYQLNNINSLPYNIYYLSFPLILYDENEKLKLENGYVPKIINPDFILETLKSRYKITVIKRIDINGYFVDVFNLTAIKSM